MAAVNEIARRSLPFLPSTLAATIYQRDDGGPMRPVGRRRGMRPGGLYYSQKMGRLVGYESANEKCDFYRAEVDTRVIRYREQPHTIEAIIFGEVRRYTPDREDHLTTDKIEIVEVKDEFEEAKDPAYTAKIEYFAEIYERMGWSFRLTTRDQIMAPTSFGTIENIQRFRRTSYTRADVNAVRAVFNGRAACRLGELAAIFPAGVAMPKLCAMMVGRELALDIASKLEPTSTVRAV